MHTHRPWQLFQPVFHGLYTNVAGAAAGSRGKFSFKNKFAKINSTVIDPSLSMDDSVKYQSIKSAVKVEKN